jgi:hypothetical protein
MVENERTIKQNYLRTEIVEKGLDSEQFINFLCEIKGEEAGDIDVWNMDELKEAVAKFKTNFSQDRGNNDMPSETVSRSSNEGNLQNPIKSETGLEPEDSGPMPKDVLLIILRLVKNRKL